MDIQIKNIDAERNPWYQEGSKSLFVKFDNGQNMEIVIQPDGQVDINGNEIPDRLRK
jgi:hypothetical protein